MPPDFRHRLFQALFTTKAKGTGIGLALSRRIVESHGGNIVLEPTETGASFLVTIPDVPHRRKTVMSLAGKILIVDDHIDLAENLAEILENAGYQTVIADSAEAALDRLERKDVAALITDYRLPGRNGAELIAELRRRGDRIPALVMSAFTDDATIELASRAGALEVMAKPVDLARMLHLVKGLGDDESVVLVVEDNHALAENLAEALATAGLQTRITGSVAAALAARPRPRAAIVDFVLPDGTGVELARDPQGPRPGDQAAVCFRARARAGKKPVGFAGRGGSSGETPSARASAGVGDQSCWAWRTHGEF